MTDRSDARATKLLDLEMTVRPIPMRVMRVMRVLRVMRVMRIIGGY